MSTSTKSVLLGCTLPPTMVPRSNVYFAFGSGRLSYDCVSCNAKCCRGFGYHVNVGVELQSQIQMRPAIRMFMERSHGVTKGSFLVKNCAPACFFLTDSGQCGVQVQHGYTAKPQTCRLFPFNRIRSVGKYLVVAPHTSLCPLQIVPVGGYSAHSDHPMLYDGMCSEALTLEVRATGLPGYTPDQLIGLERAILLLSEDPRQPDYRRFAAAQVRATSQVSGAEENLTELASGLEIDEFERQLWQVLGFVPTAETLGDVGLSHAMASCTPAIRSHLVFRSPKADAELRGVGLDRLPHALFVLYTLSAAARDAGMHDITYQTVMGLLSSFGSVISVLAYANSEMQWDPGVSVEWPLRMDSASEAPYLTLVRSLVRNRSGEGTTLGQVLTDCAPTDPIDRMLFLKQVCDRLAGRIVPMYTSRKRPLRRRSPRRALQRWALGHLAPSLLSAIAEREATKGPTPSIASTFG